MKGFIRKLILTLGWTGALSGLSGCYYYDHCVDPCYPERYWHSSRQLVNQAFAPQVRNGHVLDQTVWNYHFDTGTDKLNAGGLERLNYLARRRPAADPNVFLQTAQDVTYAPDKPDEFVKNRSQLDMKRAVAIKQYLGAVTAGGVMTEFEVFVHNPPEVGMAAPHSEPAIRQMYATPRATLPGTGFSTGGSGGGGGGGGR
jgi:hypothetical protein